MTGLEHIGSAVDGAKQGALATATTPGEVLTQQMTAAPITDALTLAPAIAPADDRAKLYTKMARVMGQLQNIPKRGKNKFHNFEYMTDEDLMAALRPAMAREGLALFASIEHAEEMPVVTKGGKAGLHVRLRMRFDLCCAETGAVHSCNWYGEAKDTEDKAINKAVTAGKKYFLKTTFAISTGNPADDADSGPGNYTPPRKVDIDDVPEVPHEHPDDFDARRTDNGGAKRDPNAKTTPLQMIYQRCHSLFPGMDWAAFGAALVGADADDTEKAQAFNALLSQYATGREIADMAAQDEVVAEVRYLMQTENEVG